MAYRALISSSRVGTCRTSSNSAPTLPMISGWPPSRLAIAGRPQCSASIRALEQGSLREAVIKISDSRYWAVSSAVVRGGIWLMLRKAMGDRSEEHTSELQSLMRSSYAVFCLKKKNNNIHNDKDNGV